MNQTSLTASLKNLLKFPFQGENWQNRFLAGTGLIFASFIVPLVPSIFLSGYILEVMRRAARGEEAGLPEWKNWGKLGLDGLKMALLGFVFTLPGTVALLGGFMVYMLSFILLPLGMGLGQSMDIPGWASGLLMLTGFLAFMLAMTLGPLLMALGLAPLPAASAHMAAQDRLAAGFEIRKWWPLLWKDKVGYLGAWVVAAGLYALLMFLFMMLYYSVVLIILLPFMLAPLSFYLGLVYARLFGLFYHDAQNQIQPEPAAEEQCHEPA